MFQLDRVTHWIGSPGWRVAVEQLLSKQKDTAFLGPAQTSTRVLWEGVALFGLLFGCHGSGQS